MSTLETQSGLTIEALEGKEACISLAEEWNNLFTCASQASVHMSLPWISCWMQRGEQHGEPLILTARRNGELVGLLPLMVRSFAGMRIAQPIGSGRGFLGVLVSDQAPEAAVQLADATRSVADLLLMHDVSSQDEPTQSFIQSLREHGWTLRRHRRNVVFFCRLLPSYDDFLVENKSGKSRHNIRTRYRNLEKDYKVKYERFRGREVDETVILRCAKIQEASWLRHRGGAHLCDPFYQELVLCCATAGLIDAWIMMLNGHDAAFGIFAVARDIYYYEWTGFRLEYKSKHSVGQVMLSRIIATACSEGLQELDFGQGDAEYKRFWSNGEYHIDRFVVSHGVLGRLLTLAVSLVLSLRKYRFARNVFRGIL